MGYDIILFILFCFILHYLTKKYFKGKGDEKQAKIDLQKRIHKNEFITLNYQFNRKKTISLLTYNILCQKFMKRRNRKDLNLENRMCIIIEEIKSLNADIICIQETNWFTYKNYFLSKFEYLKFEYGDNYGSNFINLIGYNCNKYKLISTNSLDISKVNVEGNRGVINIIIEENETKEIISIYNVHFPWKPIYELEKCFILDIIAEDILSKGIKHTIIAGDFNSIPNSILMRLVYLKDFLVELNGNKENEGIKEFVDFYELNKSNYFSSFKFNNTSNINNTYDQDNNLLNQCIKEILTKSENKNKFSNIFQNFSKLEKNLNIKSVYDKYKNYHKQTWNTDLESKNKNHNSSSISAITTHPDYTNYTEFFKNTIDYIFHSESLVPIRILRLPDKLELSKEQYLPSSKYPSDHIKLFSEFYFN